LPEFSFDIGESYAGLLPISPNATDENKLWFWFVPSTNPQASEEILVFFNGGPGACHIWGRYDNTCVSVTNVDNIQAAPAV
jgi:carboxypeptidase D